MMILDDGLDEMAARAYQGLALRMAATAGCAGVASLMLPWQVCTAWLATQSISEAIFAVVSRPQFLGHRGSSGRRLSYLATIVTGCGLWTLLGGLLWVNGTPEGIASAVILWMSVIFFAQNNAYQSTTGFLVGGGIPAIGMIGVILLAPNRMHVAILPVVGLAVIALGFVADGVMRSLGIRKRMQDTKARLMASEAQYRMLADNINDVLCLNAYDGRRIYISPSIKRALGYEAEEVFDDNFSMIHPEDADEMIRRIRETAASGGQATVESRMVHKDGHVVWMETNIGAVHADEGVGESMLISVSRNIDARKALEHQLVEARRRAEVGAAAKSDFLANMTHELRTPLNAIIGFAGVLKGSPRLSAEDARHVHLINQASDSLLGLVNSVLDFSKLEAGAVELDVAPFDPQSIARSAAALMAEQASARGLDLVVTVEGEPQALLGDEARLRQVLLNFLSNAVKFTPDGSVILKVRQGAGGQGQGLLRMEVADSGIGVTHDQVEQLFDRFTQADATVSRQYGGTGLGLAICKRTIELMDGRIGCDSAPGEGATFWFEVSLPVSQAPVAAEAETIHAPAPQSALRVLLVEDVAVNRELVAALLSPFDVSLETAENGHEAVEAMAQDRFDLVLMDVQMPVMDGLTATRAIRALPWPHAQSTPIIAMTANVLPEQVQRCRDAGMDDHIGKPISPASLLGALSRWSAGRDAGAKEATDAAVA